LNPFSAKAATYNALLPTPENLNIFSMKLKSFFFALLSFAVFNTHAQELNCTIQVLSPQLQGSDKKIFETLQQSLFEFINNRKWTNNEFLNQERIECTFAITVSERLSGDEFKASLQIQIRRPIYKTSYYSPLFSFNDPDFVFKYAEYQPLEFNENTYQSNLTSTIAFYANMIIAIDYDSFSPDGGTPYYQKAQTIANNAQNASERGWKAFESTKNRYWLAENFQNETYQPMRNALYQYHRKGLDVMSDKLDEGRAAIKESLTSLKKISDIRPNTFLMQLFFNTKVDEIVNVLSKDFPDEKNKMVNVLNEMDPANSNRYQSILKN
jgi:hypothetical protein